MIYNNTHLSNLNTKYYYASLEKGYNDCKDEKFYNAAEEKLKENHLNEEVSEQILKGLCYVYRKSLIQDYERDICKYLYYWLGNILIDKMKHNHVFQDVIRNLFNILKNQKGQICTASTYHIVVEKFKNIKLLFDYSKDYDSYMNQITEYNPPCNNNYKEYLQKYVDTYNMFQRECQDKRTYYGYCDVFDEYFAKKNPEYLSNWTCNLQPNEPEEIEESDDAGVTDEHPPSTYGKMEQIVTLSGGFEEGRKKSAKHPSSSDHLPRQDTFLNNSDLDHSNGTPSTLTSKSITGAVSVAGALVPSYLLYNVICIMFNKYNALLYIS
ncbi:hypothetical protein PVNG_05875 [Plasmodium vivax North Korean]|uniref:Variable surface protein Vir7-like protein n=1 Tax=Plasmodium vivax North Korean TaxID=1035514 RepID=A0A0J9TMX4_PLAVI|nr:hypothetical protein PVNG_05875 [Plasmodium vivax North Korean]